MMTVKHQTGYQQIQRFVFFLVNKDNISYQTLPDHRHTGKILLGGLNVICPNETCWPQMQENDSFVMSP